MGFTIFINNKNFNFMKKKSLLMLMAALLLPLSMGAQLLNAPQANGLLHYNTVGLKSINAPQKAPMHADLAENQRIMGHYDTDDLSSDGLGITGLPGTMPIATVLEPSELSMYLGGKIVAFRVGLAQATSITRVFVAPVDANGNLGSFTEWSNSSGQAGWNVITLPEPYELNLDANTALMIGFDYTQTSSNYPISAVEVGDIYPSYCYIQGAWQNVGLDSYGNLSVQCIVESDEFPDYAIRMSNLHTSNFVNLGDDINFTFKLKNTGLLPVEPEALVLDVMVDGEKVGTLTNPVEVGSTSVDMAGVVSTAGMETGEHVLTVALATLNGEAIEDGQSLDYTFKIITSSFPRQKHLIEELTSNTCTYCPLGASMLHYLMDMRNDIAMVAIHGNQSGVDPCNTAQCDTLFNYMGAQGWPYAAFNRSVGWEDDSNIACGIGYYEQYHQMVAEELSAFLDYLAEETPSFATVEINGVVTEDRMLQLDVHGDLTPDFDVMMGEDAKLTVYLTEDGLVYRQLNQGKWISDYVHNHVLRQALGSVKGVDLNKVGDNKYSNTFEVEIPADWNIDNMDVVAFISRPLANGTTGVYTDMYVNNANSVRVNELTAGVEELLIDNDAVPVEYYDVMGRQHDSLQPGINIVKMSNGTAKKVLVK